MKQSQYAGKNKSDRLEILSANAQRKEQFTYFHQLNNDELDEYKNAYFAAKTKIDLAQSELDEAKAAFKEAVAVPTQQAREAYEVVKNKGKQITDDVFLIPNYDTEQMDYVNEEGEVVFSRKLLPGERQYTLKVSNQ